MIRRITFGCLLLVSCFLTSHAAMAEAPDARDIKKIETCLQIFDRAAAAAGGL